MRTRKAYDRDGLVIKCKQEGTASGCAPTPNRSLRISEPEAASFRSFTRSFASLFTSDKRHFNTFHTYVTGIRSSSSSNTSETPLAMTTPSSAQHRDRRDLNVGVAPPPYSEIPTYSAPRQLTWAHATGHHHDQHRLEPTPSSEWTPGAQKHTMTVPRAYISRNNAQT